MYSKKNLKILEFFLNEQQVSRKEPEMHNRKFNRKHKTTKKRNRFKKLFKSNRKYSNRVKRMLNVNIKC